MISTPEDGQIVIATRHARIFVCRVVLVARRYEIENAANWRELELAARRAIETQLAASSKDDIFPCPPDLADRAEWG